MTTRRSVRLACCLVLSACLASGMGAGQAPPAGRASAAGSFSAPTPPPMPTPAATIRPGASSSWYWQNPLPRAYSVDAVACASATHCVAVGNGRETLRTSDGGRHWTAGTAGAPGTGLNLSTISCPTQVACYAIGNPSPQFATSHLVKSTDGGATWRESDLGQFGTGITCPSATTCLLTAYVSNGGQVVLRTRDGGRTWNDVLQGSSYLFLSCTSSLVCYAGTYRAMAQGPGWTYTVYQSRDAGKTWKQWSRSKTETESGLVPGPLFCLPAGTCLAAMNKTTKYIGDLFLIGNGGKTWTRVVRVERHQFAWLTCAGVTVCYAYAPGGGVFRSANEGKTWTTLSPPTTMFLPGVACPTPAACYAPAGFTLVKTTDGFNHVHETPAVSPIGTPSLGSIRCPTRSACYAFGSGSSLTSVVSTTDGGHTWAARPNLPIGYSSLTCASSTVCYAVGVEAHGSQWLVERTRNGARTWQRLTLPAQTFSLTAPTCPAVNTCYLGAQLTRSGPTPHRYRLLVTRDGGATWSVKTAIDRVPGHSAPTPFGVGGVDASLGSPSCPSVTICFETVPTFTETNSVWVVGAVVAVTRDGGDSWTVAGRCQSSFAAGPQAVCGPLTCPTVTSCYLPSSVPAGSSSGIWQLEILVTHDGGASWQSAVLGPLSNALSIACATARACRVLTSTGDAGATVFATSDGGKTWQKQEVSTGVSGIACPGADTCYAVGGMNILATHRP